MAGDYDIRDSDGRITGSISQQRSYESGDDNPIGLLIGTLVCAGVVAFLGFAAARFGLGFDGPTSTIAGLVIGGAIAAWGILRAISNPQFWRQIFTVVVSLMLFALLVGAVLYFREVNGLGSTHIATMEGSAHTRSQIQTTLIVPMDAPIRVEEDACASDRLCGDGNVNKREYYDNRSGRYYYRDLQSEQYLYENGDPYP